MRICGIIFRYSLLRTSKVKDSRVIVLRNSHMDGGLANTIPNVAFFYGIPSGFRV